MKILPKSIKRVIESFERLPGIGPKTAQRLAFYLLHVPETELELFSDSLKNLKSGTILCSECKNVSEGDPCEICQSNDRNPNIICVVEQPTDLLSIENTGKYRGVYHVLHGAIDPLNNLGPDEIFMPDLFKRIAKRDGEIKELILATNPNMEGEATAMYVSKKMKQDHGQVLITRLAHGLPVGADVEYADQITLTRALEGRREF